MLFKNNIKEYYEANKIAWATNGIKITIVLLTSQSDIPNCILTKFSINTLVDSYLFYNTFHLDLVIWAS